MPAIRLFAPAKINLCLHITGRRTDGYHTLQSLVTFADAGDEIALTPSDSFTFEIKGPYAGAFTPDEQQAHSQSTNLVVRTATRAAALFQKPLDFTLTLTKNLPLGGGIGGGSADSSATLKALFRHWDITPYPEEYAGFLLSLGADLPVCFSGTHALVSGIGEHITPIRLPEIPIVLVYPQKKSPTAAIFQAFRPPYTAPLTFPDHFENTETLTAFLNTATHNTLTETTSRLIPDIPDILGMLSANPACLLARMSGSGSTCFGLFSTPEEARIAAKRMATKRPNWWIYAGRTGAALGG